MAKKVVAVIKLAIQAGKANPAPPIGPALGQHGVNIMMFCKEYNARTADQVGMVVPVEISVYEDRSFTFVLKTPPASVLIQKAAGIEKGSGEPNKKKWAASPVPNCGKLLRRKCQISTPTILKRPCGLSKVLLAIWA